jgi:hypothetical protein
MHGKGLAVTLYAWRRRTDLIGRATECVRVFRLAHYRRSVG